MVCVLKKGMSLKIRIREMRQQRGLTLAELADMAGMSIPHLSELERGKKNLNNNSMERLARALNVNPHELISPDGATNVDRLRMIAQSLRPEDQRRLLEFAQALLDTGKE